MISIKHFFSFLFFLTTVALPVIGQTQRSLRGKVKNSEQEPLIGAAVVVRNRPAIGVTTDTKGQFTLPLPDEKGLVVECSYLGYKTAVICVDSLPKKDITIVLKDEVLKMDQVVITGTRTPKLLKDAPIVTRVISMEDIRKVDAANIGGLLQSELPGIEFSYAMNQQVSLNMSGFGGNAILFLVDGERIAGETLDNIDYCRLNLDNVERIEIVKGAASSLYGSNAVGGVVNIISRDATDPWSVNVNARYGGHQEQRYGGSVGFKSGIVSSTTNVQYNSIRSYNLGDESNKECVGDYNRVFGSKSWNFKERLQVKPTDQLKLTAHAGYFFRERDAARTQKDRYRSFNGGAKGEYVFSAKDNLELSYTFDQYDKSKFLTHSDKDIRNYSNVQHVLRGCFNHTFAGKHILTVGADYMRDYLMSYQFENKDGYTQHSVDCFAQFDWNPLDKLNIIAGVRTDYFSQSDMLHVSPKIGMMYKFGHCSLRASYAGGFRAPTLKEMYMQFDMNGIFMIYGNPNLKAESSHNLSLSAEYAQGNYSTTVTGFYNLVDNRITTAWNKSLGGQQYINMNRMRVAGIDANASAHYPCGISFRLSYAYTHEHIQKGLPILSSTRPHTATTRLSYERNWKNYGLSISLNGRFMSKMTTDVYTQQNSYEETSEETYPAYTLWNLNVTQKFWKGLSLTAGVDNLFNYCPSYYFYNSPATTGTTASIGISVDLEELF